MASSPTKTSRGIAAPGAALPWARASPVETASIPLSSPDPSPAESPQESGRKRDASEANLDSTVNGNVEATATGRIDAEPSQPGDSDLVKLRELGLDIGARLEVMWDVEDSDVSTTYWWGCKILQSDGAKMFDSQSRRVWKILYDAKPEIDEAFQDETALVTFVTKGEMFDIEQQTSLPWRIEGQEHIEEEEEDGEIPVFTMSDVLRAQAEMESEEGAAEGESVEQHAVDALSTLPMEQQQRLASGYRQFADNLKAELAGLRERKGDGYVVTADDITSMMDTIKGKR